MARTPTSDKSKTPARPAGPMQVFVIINPDAPAEIRQLIKDNVREVTTDSRKVLSLLGEGDTVPSFLKFTVTKGVRNGAAKGEQSGEVAAQ